MGIFKRIFGICCTQPPADPYSWQTTEYGVALDLARVGELSAPGGAVRLEGASLPERILVVHGEDGAFHAFVNRCTHAGRRIDPLSGRGKIQCCSVSKSTFDYDGRPVSGAAKSPLTVLRVTKQDGILQILLPDIETRGTPR